MGSYIRNAMASIPQSRDRLKNRRGTDDNMLREVWKEMEDGKIDKAKMAKREREEGRF